MVTFKKNVVFIVLILRVLSVNAQDLKIVSSGQGTTEDEATKIALRSALEDAFGTFISSSTKIENDVLISDEIVSLTRGNIKEYDVVNSFQFANGLYSVTVESVVSLNEFATYCQNKGMSITFNGKAFGMELKIREFNRKNEIKILKNLCLQLLTLNPQICDYNLITSEPQIINDKTFLPEELEKCNIEVKILILPKCNTNYKTMTELMESTFKAISLSKDEIKAYKKLNIEYYEKSLFWNDKTYYFRDKEGIELAKEVYFRLRKLLTHNWVLVDGVKENLSGLDLTYGLRKNTYREGSAVYGYNEDIYRKKKLREVRINSTEVGIHDHRYLGAKLNIRYYPDCESVKATLYYTHEEIEKLDSIKIEPFNQNEYDFIKNEINKIISKFDDIK